MPSGSHWEYFNWVVYYEDVEVDRFFYNSPMGTQNHEIYPVFIVGYNL